MRSEPRSVPKTSKPMLRYSRSAASLLASALRLTWASCHCVHAWSSAAASRRRPVPAPRPSYVVVHRHNYRVLRETVDSAQFALLSALHDGKPLGTAVALALRRCRGGPAQQGTRLRRWFRDWTAAGMFCSAERLT